MINKILHTCSCIIEFIKLDGGKAIICSAKPRILSFPPTSLINLIIHEHSCKINYIHNPVYIFEKLFSQNMITYETLDVIGNF